VEFGKQCVCLGSRNEWERQKSKKEESEGEKRGSDPGGGSVKRGLFLFGF